MGGETRSARTVCVGVEMATQSTHWKVNLLQMPIMFSVVFHTNTTTQDDQHTSSTG